MKSSAYDQDEPMLGWFGPLDSMIIGNVLDSMSDSLIVLGEYGDILYANKATEQMLGYAPGDLRQKDLSQIIFLGRDNLPFKQVFVDALEKKSIRNYREVDYRHPDGSTRRLAATTSYLFVTGEHETTFIGFLALFKDITEVFNLRREERILIGEKERIAREKLVSLHKLAMGVAHEIRNPTVTIGGFAARILRDLRNPEETRRYAGNIVEDARKLEQVVNEVQAYCDLPEARPERLALPPAVEWVVNELQPLGLQRNISLRLEDRIPEGQQVFFDPVLIKMAVSRLVTNAINFSEEGSSVEIVLYLADHAAVMEVADHGVGIEEADLDYVFNPFFSTQVHASGMGLAIVERIVHEHMGRIEVRSRRGDGTTIRIFLPDTLEPRIPF
ncbi:MAG: PAS domain S-box protein [Desulfomonile tiedjei]|nr:PAS domain S-box protein [Desulfomonile tiedjei]